MCGKNLRTITVDGVQLCIRACMCENVYVCVCECLLVCRLNWNKAPRQSFFFFLTKLYTGAFATVGKSTSQSEDSHYPQWTICVSELLSICLPIYLIFCLFSSPFKPLFCRTLSMSTKKQKQINPILKFEFWFPDVFPSGLFLIVKKHNLCHVYNDTNKLQNK